MYTASRIQRIKHVKQLFLHVAAEIFFYIAVNDFSAKKTARLYQVIGWTELIGNGTNAPRIILTSLP